MPGPGRHGGRLFEGAIGLDVSDSAVNERGRVVHGPADVVEQSDAPVPQGPSVTVLPPPTPGPPPTEPTSATSTPTTLAEPDDTVRVDEPWGPSAYPPIIRTLVVDGRLVTISHVGVMVSSLDTLTQLGWLPTSR